MKDTYLSELKAEAIAEAYEKVLKEYGNKAPYVSKMQLYKETAESTAPQFFITPNRVSQILKQYYARKRKA